MYDIACNKISCVYVTCIINRAYNVGDHCNITENFCATNPCGLNATCASLAPGYLNTYNLTYDCSNCPPGQNLTNGKCQNIS